jgi:hypothetical protein
MKFCDNSWNLTKFQVSAGYQKQKIPLLDFERQGQLCSGHGNLFEIKHDKAMGAAGA